MNIAILISELGGGGAERVAQILGNHFVDRGDKVFYFLSDTIIRQDYPVKGEIVRTSIQSCMREEQLWDVQRGARLMLSSLEMRKLKHQYKIDVAISFLEEFNYINVLSKGKEKVITRVCTILSKRAELNGFLYKKKIVRFFYSRADRVVVMSDYAWKDMHEYYGVPQKKLVKIPNGVSADCIDKKEEEWKYGEKAIVCMGRLMEVKQQDRIIRAFSYVVEREEQAKLLILGRGPLLNYLQGLCARYKIDDKVHFVGFTDQTAYYLRHSRAFVMASKAEGFPNSMIEAMSCGLPVITTDSPGACGEIVGKPTQRQDVDSIMLCRYGILSPVMPDEKVRPNEALTASEKCLGDAMLKVLTDDEIYEKYREQSLRRAKIYSLHRVMKKWNHLIGIRKS